MANPKITIDDFKKQPSLISTDQIPFLRKTTNKYCRIEYIDFLNQLKDTVNPAESAPIELTISTASANVNFSSSKKFYITVNNDTLINPVINATGDGEFVKDSIYFVTLRSSAGERLVSFDSRFNLPELKIQSPQTIIFIAQKKNELVPVIASSGSNLPAVSARYATIALMTADGANRGEGDILFVTDASADPTVTSGYAYYEKLDTNVGDLTDFRKLTEQESLEVVISDASETVKGIIQLASDVEVIAETEPVKAVSPSSLGAWFSDVLNRALTFVQKITFTVAPRFSSTIASQVLEVDENKDLISVAKGTAYNKDFGTTAGTVSEGDHSHTAEDVEYTPSGTATATNMQDAIDELRVLTEEETDLSNYYNSGETDTLLDGKVDKEEGKELYPTIDKDKLSNIEPYAKDDQTVDEIEGLLYDGTRDNHKFTLTHKNKLDNLQDRYKGSYLSLLALQTAWPVGEVGWCADVDLGFGTILTRHYWDADEGWVPGAGGSSAEAPNNSISNTKLSDMAGGTIKGKSGTAEGDPEDLTKSQVLTILNVQDGATANQTDAELKDLANATGELAGTKLQGFSAAANETHPFKDENGNWMWLPKSAPKSFAVVSPTGIVAYYGNLHSAIAGSVSGDTIEMLNDYISTTTIVPVSGTTIDTNGHSIINESTSLSSYTLYSNSPDVSWNIIGNGKIIRRGIVSATNSFSPAVWLTNNSTNNIVNIDADIIHDTRQALIAQGEGSVVKIYGHIYGAAQDSANRTACIVDKAKVEIFNDVISKNGDTIGAHVGANVIVHGNIIVESGNGYPVRVGYNNIAESAITVYGNIIRPDGATGAAIYFWNDAELKIGGAIVNSSGTEAAVHADVVEAKVTFLGPPAYNGIFPPEVMVSSIGTYSEGTGTDYSSEILALQEGKKDKYITVPTSFPVNTPLGFDFENGGAIAQASETVEHVMTVDILGKASTAGNIIDRGLAVGPYWLDEAAGGFTATKPTEGLVKLAYLQGVGVGIDLWHSGYTIGESTSDLQYGSEAFEI